MAEVNSTVTSTTSCNLTCTDISRSSQTPDPALPTREPDAHSHLPSCAPQCKLNTGEHGTCKHRCGSGEEHDSRVDTSQSDHRHLSDAAGSFQLLLDLCVGTLCSIRNSCANFSLDLPSYSSRLVMLPYTSQHYAATSSTWH